MATDPQIAAAKAVNKVAGAKASPGANSSGDSTNHFAGILSKSLWVRIGVGAVGALLVFGAIQLNLKDAL